MTFEHLQAALIGYWRMGAMSEMIAATYLKKYEIEYIIYAYKKTLENE